MEKKTTLGELIEKEVRKQGMGITAFGRMINCERNNVYDIFKRTSIDVELLGRISKVLNHNFFEDVAKDLELVDIIPETDEEREKRMAVNQLFEVVPQIFKKLGFDATIMLTQYHDIDNSEVPDFYITPFAITLTIGQYFKEKVEAKVGDVSQFLQFTPYESPDGTIIYIIWNKASGIQSVDMKLDYKTAQEWENIIRFTLDLINNRYLPRTWKFLNQ